MKENNEGEHMQEAAPMEIVFRPQILTIKDGDSMRTQIGFWFSSHQPETNTEMSTVFLFTSSQLALAGVFRKIEGERAKMENETRTERLG